jgi:hypothetical protein
VKVALLLKNIYITGNTGVKQVLQPVVFQPVSDSSDEFHFKV